MSYVIVTDTVLGQGEAFLLQNGVCTVPQRFTIDGWDTVEDDFGRSVPYEEFYAEMRSGKTVTTEPAAKEAFLSVFEGILKSRRDVVYLGLSSALSENFQTACAAAEELKDKYFNQIYCVDTRAVSCGQAMLVREAIRRRAEGILPEQLAEWAEEFSQNIRCFLLADDITYLQRSGYLEKKNSLFGGRGVTSQFITLDRNGGLTQGRRIRGRKKALEQLRGMAVSDIPEGSKVYISHADCREDAEEIANYLLDRKAASRMECYMLNEVLGAHIGPGAIGIFFYKDH